MDEILDLIESVSVGFPTYSFINSKHISFMYLHIHTLKYRLMGKDKIDSFRYIELYIYSVRRHLDLTVVTPFPLIAIYAHINVHLMGKDKIDTYRLFHVYSYKQTNY